MFWRTLTHEKQKLLFDFNIKPLKRISLDTLKDFRSRKTTKSVTSMIRSFAYLILFGLSLLKEPNIHEVNDISCTYVNINLHPVK